MEPELKAFLDENPEFELNSYGKVHCNVTNHDIVAKMSEVEKHMKSAKYLHAKNWYSSSVRIYAQVQLRLLQVQALHYRAPE